MNKCTTWLSASFCWDPWDLLFTQLLILSKVDCSLYQNSTRITDNSS
ncbi:hypothetical protein T06_420 [Trichinella sp. T6]|nr:hypothetical protein T06_420 [Trichinella sp. T6]